MLVPQAAETGEAGDGEAGDGEAGDGGGDGDGDGDDAGESEVLQPIGPEMIVTPQLEGSGKVIALALVM